MRLRQLLDPGVAVQGHPDHDPTISALTADSRKVGEGTLFAGFAGSATDGRLYIEDAIAKGAVAILTDPSMHEKSLAVPLVLDPEPRRLFARMAGRFHGTQPEKIVAVTGTNGKTSIATFTRQLWRALGRKAASLGTLGLEAPGFAGTAGLTTPDPVSLHALLADLAKAGIQHLALEASSHGLDQHRLDGVDLKAAAFTNLSRDHFDYHGSVEAYFEAKARLFRELLPAGATAVLNADIPEIDRLKAICRERELQVVTYGRAADDVRLIERHARGDGQDLTIAVQGRSFQVKTSLMGDFQADNLLAALALASAGAPEAPIEDLVAALEEVRGAPGRLQRIDGSDPGLSVFIDYAHTPDALAHVLQALRPHTAGRLMVVFGCGGDRDRGKRPAMGRIAADHADNVFITDDNPRSEDPASIRRAILDACPGAADIGDRKEAIHLAVSKLGVGDVLVVAGKGHETGQIVGSSVIPFDDAAVVKAALAEVSGPGPMDRASVLHGRER